MAPTKLKVLLVTSEFPPHVGGIASHVAELSRALAPLCDRIIVVDPRGLGVPAADFAPQGVTVLRPALIKAEPFYTPMLAGWLAALTAGRAFDLVHVHGVRPLAATRTLNAPTVFTNHSSGFLKRLHASPHRKARTARLLGHVRRLIAPSDELVEAAQSLGYAGPAEMIANGVDVERFRPGPPLARQAWGVGPDEVVVLLARRLAQKNGVLWFAKAAGRLKPLNCRIVIAGDGAERAAMTAALGENGMLARPCSWARWTTVGCPRSPERRHRGAALAGRGHQHRWARGHGLRATAGGHAGWRHTDHRQGRGDRIADPARGR